MGVLERIGRRRVGEQVAELGVALAAPAEFRDTGASVDSSTALTRSSGIPVACASSPRVASRPSSAWSSSPARSKSLRCSWICTGMRIVRAWFAIARWQDWRIHQVAYVENL